MSFTGAAVFLEAAYITKLTTKLLRKPCHDSSRENVTRERIAITWLTLTDNFAKPVAFRSVKFNMSNTDWKGRVSKLYDQIAGNVHFLRASAGCTSAIQRMNQVTHAGLSYPGIGCQ